MICFTRQRIPMFQRWYSISGDSVTMQYFLRFSSYEERPARMLVFFDAVKPGPIVFNKSRGCYSKFCNVLNKKGYGLFTLRVVILNHEINKHRREWLCIY